jgi:hypothetical protein
MIDQERRVDRSGGAVGRNFAAVAERLHADHPDVSTEAILGMLWTAYHDTERATVQTFRTLLAERDVRGRLLQHDEHALHLDRIA